MGEMADYYNEMYDYNEEDDDDYETVCNRCGEPGLVWGNDGTRRWFLMTPDGERHSCKAKDSDFEVLP